MLLRTVVALAITFAGHRMVKANVDTEIAKGLEMCDELFSVPLRKEHSMRCCEGFRGFTINHASYDAKCKAPAPDEDWKCEYSECVSKEYGFLKDDRTLDFKQAAKMYDYMDKENPMSVDFVDKVRKQCSEENFVHIRDDCAGMDFQNCILVAVATECPKWKKDDSHCMEVLEKATICKSAMVKLAAKEG